MARVWGPAGLGAPGVGVAWAGEAEHLDGTHVIRAGVEQPAQLGVQGHGAGGGVEVEETAGEGAAVGGPFAVPVPVSPAPFGGWRRGGDGGVETPGGLGQQLHDPFDGGELTAP
jgi:hypothetical protein